jgi:hypothetical protein
MSSPGSLSPKHPQFQARLASLRTAGRWELYSRISPKPHRQGTLVTLFSETTASVAASEVEYQAAMMRTILKDMKAKGAFISGDVTVGADGGRLLITSGVVIDPMDMPQFQKAHFYGYMPR